MARFPGPNETPSISEQTQQQPLQDSDTPHSVPSSLDHASEPDEIVTTKSGNAVLIERKSDINRPSVEEVVAQRIIDLLNEGMSLDEAVAEIDIPFKSFTDSYWKDHPDIYSFGTMLRSFVYGELRGIRYDNDLADFLDDHADIAFRLGFEPEVEDDPCPSLNVYNQPKTPHQTTITRCANKRFKARTEKFIQGVSEEVEAYCREHGHLLELTELWSEDPDKNPGEEEDEIDPDGLSKNQIRRLVNEFMRHACPHIDFKRGQSRELRKNLFLEVIAHCSLTGSSVYNGGDAYEIYAKPTDEELPAGKTFFDHMKGLSVEEMLEMFDNAISSMVDAARDVGLYDRPVDIALDVTTLEFTGIGKTFGYDAIADPDDEELKERERSEAKTAIEKWDLEPLVGEDPADIKHANFEDSEKVAAANRVKKCVEWVSGTKEEDEDIEYGFQFAAGAIAEKTCPMLYTIEPISTRDGERMREHVKDAVNRAQELVVVDTVYMDSYYDMAPVHNLFHYGHGFRTSDRFDIDYTLKKKETNRVKNQVLRENYTDLEETYAEGDTPTTISHNFAVGTSTGREKGHTTLVAVEKRDADGVDNKVTDRVVFATNRRHVDGAEAARAINGYRDRWIVENGFKEAKKFLAYTTSPDNKPRVFYFIFAVLLFSMWMLIDRVAKHRLGLEFAGEPLIGFEVFVAAIVDSLRPVD